MKNLRALCSLYPEAAVGNKEMALWHLDAACTLYEALEKKTSPRSTYTVMESFTTIGSERKKRAPKRAHTGPSLFLK